ncbi:hypothetical protein [Marinobacterium rhizophilum]|uniref:hypothetical protein n=1 Tax=Marinobacterium rhizophilum TaxID=420402 RepID=UPI0003656D00|nr:hypothetical protein [Marinobacterium rhizophilum]
METFNRKHLQRGVATLIVTLVLLVAVLGMSFFMANAVVTEKQIVAGELRAKQALMAGQSGIDYGIAYIRVDPDQNGDLAADQWLASTAVAVGEASFLASMADGSLAGTMGLLLVEGQGFSDDSAVQRTVTQAFGTIPLLPNPPDMPLVARGSVDLTGNIDVTNNAENITIWTGAKTTSWGDANTYITIDGNPDQLSTSKNTKGPDVIDGDENLAGLSPDSLLENFLGRDWDALAASATMTEIPDPISEAGGNLIYIDGDVAINGGDWGSEGNPVILVVKGELEIGGNVNFYGLIVTEDLTKGVGTPVINGGIIATGNMDFGAGNFSVIFNTGVFVSLGEMKEIAAVNSSWKDWGN